MSRLRDYARDMFDARLWASIVIVVVGYMALIFMLASGGQCTETVRHIAPGHPVECPAGARAFYNAPDTVTCACRVGAR